MYTHLGPFLALIALGSLAFAAVATSSPKWPYGHQLYHEEYLLYEGTDLPAGNTNGCPRRFLTTIPAQWIRLAYHDAATHNVEDGTGGLDASIRFELDRPENIGSGMLSSLADFRIHQTPHVSLADLIAMGTIFSFAGCGGPTHTSIPFRAGRKDATSAGPPGVPEAHQDLHSHIDAFKRQGFNQEEMITLVACGHTNGGVRKDDFGTIVTGNESFALFNGEHVYSRRIVTGYLDGTTTNPLVVASNITMRSDLRIFSSDGNATVHRLAQGTNLDTECASLIERMINTVPKDVQLTEPILPIEFKVGKARLFPSNDSDSLVLTTTLRTLDLPANSKRTITLFWNDREGTKTCPSIGCSVRSASSEAILTGSETGFKFLGVAPERHTFRAIIDPTTSISKFWFEIDEGDGNAKKVVDNDGEGFIVDQDDVLFDPARSVLYVTALGNPRPVRQVIVVGVKTSLLSNPNAIPNLTLTTFNPNTGPPFNPEIGSVALLSNAASWSPMAGYTFFSANVSSGSATKSTTTVTLFSKMRTSTLSLLTTAGLIAAEVVTSNPKWPYGYQLYQEEYLFYEGPDMAGFTTNCLTRDSTTLAAQWIRLAYHDMATHNAEDGTGGLDASIRFELDRAENPGSGMQNTLEDFTIHQTPDVSLADVIAMGTIFAYASCGGPSHTSIPYRGGRKDAISAGPPGAPEPQQDIQSHIDSFRRQGFTQEEMIALVACGHTVGGVRKVDFETIVTGSDKLALFTGKQSYNREVVTGYLDGTTPNPLIVTPNVTMRSDLRIFGSDGNATMKRLAEGNNFDTTCASLVERMINTVPKGVQLTDPILPIQYKVGKIRLYPSNDSDSLILTTTLRTLDLPTNLKRTIMLFWNDREGTKTCPTTGCSVQSASSEIISTDSGNGFKFLGVAAERHAFRAVIDSMTSIGKFWFAIDEGEGSGGGILVDNEGEGFGVDQDDVLFDPVRSMHISEIGVGSRQVAVVAVKTALLSSAAPDLTLTTFNPFTSLPFIPEISTLKLTQNTIPWPPAAGYTFFAANMSGLIASFDVLKEGIVVQEFVQTREILTSVTVGE
ncbi:hypothetical protein V5O48_005467 [Marasmius crinis-equi]|uniref:Peroxidase n=1 Tax=Marasmius crinis-equi TaxID=585013 RepID=A0ABR3FM86_9AGAR